MPRRPPPSPLRLIDGPLPGRGKAKHTLPSVPRPVHVPTDVSRTLGRVALEPRIVAGALFDVVYERMYAHSAQDVSSYRRPRRRSIERCLDTSGLVLPAIPSSFGVGLARNSASVGSTPSHPPLTTPSPGRSPSPQPTFRGRWDHSRAVSLSIDVGSVLALPKPVAITP